MRDWKNPVAASMVQALAIFLAYLLLGKLGLSLGAVSGFASLVWAPSGIALASLLLLGLRFWPAIYSAAFLVNLSQGAALLPALGIASGNTLEAVTAAYLLRDVFGCNRRLLRPRDVFLFIGIGAMLCTAISATIGTAVLLEAGVIKPVMALETWSYWWLGDMLGALVVGPVVLDLSSGLRLRAKLSLAQAEAAALAAFTLLASSLIFHRPAAALPWLPGEPYFLFPIVIWAAARFQQRGAALVTLAISAFAIWGTSHGFGVFFGQTGLSENLFHLQTFVAVISITSLVFATVSSDNLATNLRLQQVVEKSPYSVAMFDTGMRYLFASEQWLKEHRFRIHDIRGRSHYEVFPGMPAHWREIHRRCLEGATEKCDGELFLRADGTPSWIRWEIRPWYQHDGEIGGILIFSEDISRKKASEQVLAESEARLRNAITESPIPMLLHAEDGENLLISKGWTEFSGYTLEDIPTIEDWTLKAYGERSKFLKGYIDTLFNLKEKVHNGEFTVRTKKGESRIWDFYTAPCGTLADGRRLLISTASDVTDRKLAEQSVQESEQRFRGVYDQAAIGIACVSLEGKWLTVNQKILDIVGYTKEELLEMSFQEITHPDDLAADLELANQILLGNSKTYSMEKRYMRKDGAVVWINLSVSLVRDSAGKPNHFVSVVEDISARKHVELERKKFVALANGSLEFIGMCDADFRPFYVNEAGLRALGLDTLEEALQIHVRDCFFPEDQDFIMNEFFPKVLREGHAETEIRFRNFKTGEPTWMLYNVFNLKDETGQLLGWATVSRNITAQKQAVFETQASLKKLQKALKEVSDIKFALDQSSIVSTTDAKGRITYVNDKFCEISGYSRDELLGADHRIIRSGHHPQEYMRELWRAIKCGRAWRGEIKNRAKDGSHYWVVSTIVPSIDESGIPFQFTAISKDITQKKRMEKESAELAVRERAALEASRLKSEFLANMSHEIRTPINGILGMTSLLARTRLDSEQERFLKAIGSSSNQLLALVNDVLDLSKVEAGKLELEIVPFDLPALVKDVAAIFDSLARAKGLAFSFSAAFSSSTQLSGDPSRIRQVLNNLLSNAIKFTEAGAVSLSVRQTAVSGGRVLVEFQVKDTGIGMTPETTSRLFENFMQADASTSRKYGGTGLGLAICRRIAGLLEGTIQVSSVPARGTTVVFALELNFAKESPKEPEPRARIALPYSIRSAKAILIVEDNPINLEIAQRVLQLSGYRVETATNGLEALERVELASFDLILMDCHMPEMDGFEAVRILRERGFFAPIIALTADAISGDRDRCLAAGMSDYLAKPITDRDLVGAVDFWVSDREPEPASRFAGSIDLAMVERIRALETQSGDRLLPRLLELYEHSSREALEAMRKASLAGDKETIRKKAHSLKSSSGNLGATIVAKICEQLECQEAGDAADQHLLSLLAQEVEDAVLALRSLLAGGADSLLPGRETLP